MSHFLAQKRPATDPPEEGQDGHRQEEPTESASSTNINTRYQRLLSVVEKSLAQSRQNIADDAPSTIADSYGDMTSLFASENDDDGIETLTTLLMGTLERVHDSFYSSQESGSSSLLEKLLKEQSIFELLQRVELSVGEVERTEKEWNEKEEKDSRSARDAVDMARLPGVAVNQDGNKSGKKKLILPAEYIGYHAYQLKLQHQQNLLKEISSLEESNEAMERDLKEKWEEWTGRVRKVKGVLAALDELEAEKETTNK